MNAQKEVYYTLLEAYRSRQLSETELAESVVRIKQLQSKRETRFGAGNPVSEPAGAGLEHVRCFLLDMDGTFYLGEALLPGALEFIDILRRQGRDFLFLTNNSSHSQDDYAAKITRLGLPVDRSRIFTSGEATARYLRSAMPDARVALFGPPSLHAEFREHGVELEEAQPTHIVLGFDTTLTYASLWRLCDLVRSGLPFIATLRLMVGKISGAFSYNAWYRASLIFTADSASTVSVMFLNMPRVDIAPPSLMIEPQSPAKWTVSPDLVKNLKVMHVSASPMSKLFEAVLATDHTVGVQNIEKTE